MTISSEMTSATHTGNGVTTVWPYTFKIPDVTSVIVRVTTTVANVDTSVDLLAAQYSITGVGGVDGNVTYPLAGAPLAANQKLSVIRNVGATQELDIVNQAGFYPEVIEGALDKLTMMIHQLKEPLTRALSRPIGSDNFDAENRRIVNVGGTVAAGDAMNKLFGETWFLGLTSQGVDGVWAGRDKRIASVAGPVDDKDVVNKEWSASWLMGLTEQGSDGVWAGRDKRLASIFDPVNEKDAVNLRFLSAVIAELETTSLLTTYGAVGDGDSHPLSEIYSTLAAAQVVFPHVSALTDERDWAAIQKAVNTLALRGGAVLLPPREFVVNKPIIIGDGVGGVKSTRQNIRFAGTSGVNSLSFDPANTVYSTLIRATADMIGVIEVHGPVGGVWLENFGVDCAGLADRGVYWVHGFNGGAKNVSVFNYVIGWDFTAFHTPGADTYIGACDIHLQNCSAHTPAVNAATAIILGSAAAGGLLDVARFTADNCVWHYPNHADGVGVDLRFFDNAEFRGGFIYATGPLGSAIKTTAATGNTAFPQLITFRNVATVGRYTWDPAWTPQFNRGVQFRPMIREDFDTIADPIPNNIGVNGELPTGEPFGPNYARDVVYSEANNTAAETTVFSGVTVVGGAMSTFRKIEFDLIGSYLNNSGVTKAVTLRVKLGATTVISFGFNVATAVGYKSIRFRGMIANRGVDNQQVAYAELILGGEGSAAASPAAPLPAATTLTYEQNASTVNTAVNQAFSITAQNETAAATIIFGCDVVFWELK